jgi:hypothetical protein
MLISKGVMCNWKTGRRENGVQEIFEVVMAKNFPT